jgi:hypothetical protein
MPSIYAKKFHKKTEQRFQSMSQTFPFYHSLESVQEVLQISVYSGLCTFSVPLGGGPLYDGLTCTLSLQSHLLAVFPGLYGGEAASHYGHPLILQACRPCGATFPKLSGD